MLCAQLFPELHTNLVAALTNLNCNQLPRHLAYNRQKALLFMPLQCLLLLLLLLTSLQFQEHVLSPPEICNPGPFCVTSLPILFKLP